MKTKPEFRRDFQDGSRAYCAHAEMSAVSKLKDIRSKDILYVLRFTKTGKITMAKPCSDCRAYLLKKGIKKVQYTDWDGAWVKLNL